jgi:hypothetical protein
MSFAHVTDRLVVELQERLSDDQDLDPTLEPCSLTRSGLLRSSRSSLS